MKIIQKYIVLLIILSALFRLTASNSIDQKLDLDKLVSVIPDKPSKQLIWYNDIDVAMVKASIEYKPVMIVFMSPDCPWCLKLEDSVFTAPELQPLLKEMILVKIDITKDKKTARFYQVTGVPTISFYTANNMSLFRINGFTDKETLLKAVSSVINKKIVAQKAPKLVQLITALKKQTVTAAQWPEVMLAISRYTKVKKDIITLVTAITPFPAKPLVKMLHDKRLSVRLGALEVLEERAGTDLNFDPWAKLTSPANITSLNKWNSWATAKKHKAGNFVTLTADRCSRLLLDAICGDRKREIRAARILRNGGNLTATAIREFLQQHPNISKGKRNKIKLLEYSIYISAATEKDPLTLAHKLIFGKIDSRMNAIAKLKTMGTGVIPILQELMNDHDPVIRETTIDALVAVAGFKALSLLDKHLKQEKDIDVTFTILRNIGNIKSSQTGKILTRFLKHPNEDLVIIALQGIASSDSKLSKKNVVAALKDQRWRVRIAALDAVSKLRIKSALPAVEKLITDEDDFVKYKTVETLSKLAGKKSIKTLKKAFFTNDSLKGAIVAAFGSLRTTIPDEFIENLRGKDDQILIATMQGMYKCDKEALPLALFFAEHKNPDISIPALRFIAENGITKGASKYNGILEKNLASKNPKLVLAILQDFKKPRTRRSNLSSYDLLQKLEKQIETASAKNSGDKSSKAITDLFSSFETPSKKQQKKVKQPTSAQKIVDLFGAFGSDEKSSKPLNKRHGKLTSSSVPASTIPEKSLNELYNSIKKIFNTSTDKELKLYSATIMALTGYPESLTYLKDNFNNMTVEVRLQVLEAISDSKNSKTIELAFSALQDANKEVRGNATELIMKAKQRVEFIRLLDILKKPDAKLKPYDFARYYFGSALKKSNIKKAARKWATEVIDHPKSTRLITNFAVYIIDKTWENDDYSKIEKLIKSPDKWIRRAVFHAISQDKTSHSKLIKYSAVIANDPDAEVRIVLPLVIQANKNRERGTDWVHFYDDKNFTNDYNWDDNNSTRKWTLSVNEEQALRKLLKDDDSKVRMEAAFALIMCRKTVDLNTLMKTLQSFSDQRAIAHKVKNFLENNYRYLGKNFNVMLTYLDNADRTDSDIKKVLNHFKAFDKPTVTKTKKALTFLKTVHPGKNSATFVKPAKTVEPLATTQSVMRLVYFTKKGCQDCAKVNKELKKLNRIFPELKIETHNIMKVTAMRLNETYCERFGVPDKLRLVAPAIFTGGGYLIKSDIKIDRLIPLTANSTKTPLDKWYNIDKKDIQLSEKRIETRYDKTSVWMFLFAGLLDGINPCAFATIIFFISYLQITKRKRLDILLVGISFIAAVFISYFAFGLGINEIIGRLYIFDLFRLWFNRIMALMVFTVMVMSIYDGILCLRGKMTDMTLQLPEFLKKRIHSTIRTGAKNSKFIIAAFIVGCIVSFLELACTGQVYAPMIGYMWQTGSDYSGTLFYLTLYNLMFILPLIVIFTAVYFGLTNNALINIFKKNAATVKFATALLFLALLISLLYTSF